MQNNTNYVIIILIEIQKGDVSMNIEVKVEKNCAEPKIIIYTNQMNKEISDLIERISNIGSNSLKAFKDEKMYIVNQEDIETIYAESGKVYMRCNNELYIVKNRLYELETLLDRKAFIRISNSEIVNFNKVENIDFKIIGTLVLNFKSGNISYVSRRYIPKIKEFLEI